MTKEVTEVALFANTIISVPFNLSCVSIITKALLDFSIIVYVFICGGGEGLDQENNWFMGFSGIVNNYT